MKSTVFIVLATFIALCRSDELSECKCWSGYEPKKSDDGIRCFGVKLLHAMECNEPQRPDCKCSGNVTGILSDSSGTWCTEYIKGEDSKKWPCENKEEWDMFFKKYPNEKP